MAPKSKAGRGPSSSDRAEMPNSSSSAEQPATSLRSFFSSAAPSSSGRAAPPAAASSSCSHAASSNSGSAAQPAREAAQPVKALRSITDVQRWLKSNEVALSSSAEAMRIGEVVDALSTLSKAKSRQKAIEHFFNPWGVQQRIKKDRRPLPELIEELNKKVIDAAKKLQQQLPDSAERPALLSDSAEQPVPMDTPTTVELEESPTLTDLRARQRKRAQATIAEGQSQAEQQRAHAKPKAAKRQNKRTAGTTSDSVEQPASKRPQRCLTAELFTQCARDPSEPAVASSCSAAQPAQIQQKSQRMQQLWIELKKLRDDGWVVDDAMIELQDIIARTKDLRFIPATFAILRQQSMRAVYTPICDALSPKMQAEQDRTFVSLVACLAVEDKDDAICPRNRRDQRGKQGTVSLPLGA